MEDNIVMKYMQRRDFIYKGKSIAEITQEVSNRNPELVQKGLAEAIYYTNNHVWWTRRISIGLAVIGIGIFVIVLVINF